MTTLRINLDLSVPESLTGTMILQTTNPDGSKSGGIKLPNAVITALQSLKTTIQGYKQYCEKINAGQPNEEASVTAEYYLCHHDDPLHLTPDEPRIEI